MPNNITDKYGFIKNKIRALKENFSSLRDKSDEYVFTALCVKSNFYKNPALNFTDNEINSMIVDGACDGGVDALLTDPNSEESNLILVQSKFYQTISFEDVKNAVMKMAFFYTEMEKGRYERISERVQRRFLSLNSEVGDESKVCFVLYTSAPKNSIRKDRIEKLLFEYLNDSTKFTLSLYFVDDVCEEIKESESRRATVENGKIKIDETDNCLYYGDDAVFVNVSAFSIKELYAEHSLNLLARNLRYHVAGRDIDKAIQETIKQEPDRFWYKNNGLTIICDDFTIDGKFIKLRNFSIVNGGQTTYMIHRSNEIDCDNDLFVPCKIIRLIGDTEDEKNLFSLEIAKATNSQKAIKKVDLKSNSPEQVRFAAQMRECEIYYQTKRGEEVPSAYKQDYKNTDLSEIGKLCLSAIFQLPATSRSKPSSLYNPEYYDLIFNGNQQQIAKLSKELLYIDSYFRNAFLKKFDDEYANNPQASEFIPFAHNARTSCLAFVVFASRYHCGNITNEKLNVLFQNYKDTSSSGVNYQNFKNIEGYDSILPPILFKNLDKYDEILYKLFVSFIKSGRRICSIEKESDSSLNETNFLKKDSNYYKIIKQEWDNLSESIQQVFSEIDSYVEENQ